jgi:branched-chain amino acid transport system substrate-binding protein
MKPNRMGRLGPVLWALALAVTLLMGCEKKEQPIKIGFSMPLTGALAQGGKAALLAMEIWRDEINEKGGLLGRQVELVYYDDQTKGSNVPAIYSKLLDVDGVDFVVSGYGTNVTAPAIPVVMQRELTFISLFATAANETFNYPCYFQIMPAGPRPAINWSEGFFDVASKQNPKPKTVALLSSDAEFAQNTAVGTRVNAKKFGFDIVYDEKYPPNTTDYTPIVRAIKALNPDIVYYMSYPPESVGLVKASKELGLVPKMIGGTMVGLHFTAIQTNLGQTLNGISNYGFWVPEPTMNFPGIENVLKKYQAEAPEQDLDPLGYYLPPFAYAYVEILGKAIAAVGELDQKKVCEYMHATEFDTVVGKVKFGENGEWAKSRMLTFQFQNITANTVEEFSQAGKMVVLYPPEFKSGELIYPFPGWQ